MLLNGGGLGVYYSKESGPTEKSFCSELVILGVIFRCGLYYKQRLYLLIYYDPRYLI